MTTKLHIILNTSIILCNFEVDFMEKMRKYIGFALSLMVVLLLAACASIGRPEGGPRDEVPPVFVGSKPIAGALNVTEGKIELMFDENVEVKDVSDKVIVSPAQKSMPSITSLGRRVVVELRDTLIPDVTYTIDFSDAICDLNEGNPLDGFAIDFSTGDHIDTLRISGMLFEARTLEPAQGMLVGVYSNLSDTAIATLPLERITKTNQYGQFTIRNLKPGEYRLFAVNDMNRDYHWDRSEDVAFYDVTVSPSVENIEVTDTLRASTNMDSLVTRQGVRYLPNDVLMTWFNEGYQAQYLKDYKRPDRRRLTFNFAAPSDSLPQITIVNGKNEGKKIEDWALLNASASLDTLEYWIFEPDVLAQDSLLVAARYLRTDTLDQLSWTTDTLKLFFKEPKKKKKDEEATDSVPQLNFLTFSPRTSSQQELNAPVRFTASQPIDTILPEGVHFEILRDTIWETLPMASLRRDSIKLLDYTLAYEWEPGGKYRITIDSAAIVGVYNEWNKPIKHEFTVKQVEDYANLYFSIPGVEQPVIVELLDSSDKPLMTAPVSDGKASFHFVAPNTYYARAYIDANGNGEYDTGNISELRQPEEVYYYPKKLIVRKNWDITQPWNIYELPIDMQKPNDIKKNKPVKKNGEEETHDEEEDEEDSYYDDGFGGNGYNTTGNGTDRLSSPSGVGGGFRNAAGTLRR